MGARAWLVYLCWVSEPDWYQFCELERIYRL